MKHREGGPPRAGGAGASAPANPPSEPVERSATDRSTDLPPAEATWPDTRLVRECVRGSEEAWAALLHKYKNLIFSIPVRRGLPREDAADVFQRVCLLLLAELPHLREAKALPMWLIRVTSHECERWRRQEHPYVPREGPAEPAELVDEKPLPDDVIADIKQEQVLREAVAVLSPRCQKLIEMLFFEAPARPYRQVAERLGLAAGSIGFIRGRCLTRLRRELEKRGMR